MKINNFDAEYSPDSDADDEFDEMVMRMLEEQSGGERPTYSDNMRTSDSDTEDLDDASDSTNANDDLGMNSASDEDDDSSIESTDDMEDAIMPRSKAKYGVDIEAEKKKSAEQRMQENLKLKSVFFDQHADERDAKYAAGLDDKRRAALQATNDDLPPFVSDAVLSCPNCFTVMCRDCQQHDRYHDQYRAMFVENCIIDHLSRDLSRPPGMEFNGCDIERLKIPNNYYSPVMCTECSEEVAACDQDEVYHFYNVVAEQV